MSSERKRESATPSRRASRRNVAGHGRPEGTDRLFRALAAARPALPREASALFAIALREIFHPRRGGEDREDRGGNRTR